MQLHRTAIGSLLALCLACSPEPSEPDSGFPAGSQQVDLLQTMREAAQTPKHPGDGGGRAFLESTPPEVAASQPGRWTLIYEAGPHGIAPGGMLFLQVSPFWEWSTPQVEIPEAPGFTRVQTDSEGVELAPLTLDQQLLGIAIGGKGLEEGDRVRIIYGAGPAGARADRYAERGSHFWIAVDADGDGVRAFLEESPSVNVLAGPPARLVLTLPSVARPGERIRLHVAVLDVQGNAGVPFAGSVALQGAAPTSALPDQVAFAAEDRGRKTLEFTAPSEGILRIEGSAGELVGTSNPLRVSLRTPRVLWGDLHGHSNFSDGTGVPEDYFLYARDVAGLDVVALTDHDHWGIPFLDEKPRLWDEIRSQTLRFHEPGRFVTLLGYEWTSWLHGHRHVLYFDDEGEVLSWIAPQYETPAQLWSALRGKNVLTFAHHSAGGPIATNWEYPPDPELEPMTEIVSVHGSSEAPDSPFVIYEPVPGNFVRDVLNRGYRLGFVGSGDSHDGHPGLSQIASGVGGLAAIFAKEPTRESVLAALRARRAYATSGPRILLHTELAQQPMGAVLAATELGADTELQVEVVAPAEIESVEVIRSGVVLAKVAGEGRLDLGVRFKLHELAAGEYLYVRVIQQDGGFACSSPYFIE